MAVAAVYRDIEAAFDPPYGEDPASEHVVLIVAACTLFVLLLAMGMSGMAAPAALCQAVLKEAVTGERGRAARPLAGAAADRRAAGRMARHPGRPGPGRRGPGGGVCGHRAAPLGRTGPG
ncbi:hypothetical protein AB0B01_24080 [Streptomyces sp. NPDC044571]|uniref:hypothetical protein n=1 Tax=Streptomyces sp. NPDC044571 TaxID=3155371 RepID=UPI0033F9C8B4